MAANNVSSQPLVLEMAGDEERPTYLGLSSTMLAPFLLVAPFVAGMLADAAGLRSVFAAAALLSGLAAAAYLLRVQEPRRAG
jgi:MFS family permease